MSTSSRLFLFACTALTLSGAAQAVTINVTAYAAPNIFGSPSYPAAESNALAALRTGASTAGTANTPTYYQAITAPVGYGNIIATNFNSWKGVANPGAPYQNELGNRIHYGLTINGQGAQFSIAQLSFATDGNDPTGYFDYDFGTGYDYSASYVGILFGADGVLGGGDDTEITSGPSTQLVDYLVGRGSGMADAVTCGAAAADYGPCGAGNQGYIDGEIAFLQAAGFTSLTGTYSLGAVTGSTTVNFAEADAVPEPATWLTMIAGFGLAGGALRRRRATAVAA